MSINNPTPKRIEVSSLDGSFIIGPNSNCIDIYTGREMDEVQTVTVTLDCSKPATAIITAPAIIKKVQSDVKEIRIVMPYDDLSGIVYIIEGSNKRMKLVPA